MPGQHRSRSPSPQRSPSPPPPPQPTGSILSPILANHQGSSPTAGSWSPTRQISLQQPSQRRTTNHPQRSKLIRRVRSVFRAFPIITPTCRIPYTLSKPTHDGTGHIHGGTRITGTLFGYRKARINLAIQDNPRCLPILLLELAIPTGKLLHDMGLGLVRVALECDRNPTEKTKIMDEPIWTMYCNGKKTGYGIKREATDEDLKVMQMLHAVSMGAGVLPPPPDAAPELPDGELTYMRAFFERVVGSKDSETYYMVNPDGNGTGGPELSIFFVRI